MGRKSKSFQKILQNAVQEALAKPEKVNNGLEGAIFGSGVPGGGIPFSPQSSQNISQVNNLFPNLRWYFASNFRQALSEAYCELGLIQTVVDVPVDDGLRGGVEIDSKELTPEQLDVLRDRMDREDDLGKLSAGLKWMRLFGGGGVMILTNQDPMTPLDLSQLGPDEVLEFRGVDMWELYFDLQNTQGYDPNIQSEKYDFYSYYGTKVHKSRVLKLVNFAAPSFLRPRLRGWGLSIVEGLVRGLNSYLEGQDLIYELMDEAKVDVYQIKNLTNTLLNPNGTAQVGNRIQVANKIKNYQHALVMDKEDGYEQKQLTFAGLAEVMKENRIEVASALRMPLTKIFGLSASGFNSGEDDIEVYNGMIESTIRTPAKKHILRMAELRCQQLFGFIPEDLSVEFEPLKVLSAEQLEKVKTEQFNRLLQSLSSGAISLDEFRNGCNSHDLLGIQLEDVAMPGSDEVGNIPGQDEDETDEEAGNENNSETLAFRKPAVKEGGPPKSDKPKKEKAKSPKVKEGE